MIAKQQGHVLTEWVMVTFVVVMMLFAPIPGYEQSAVGLLMESLRDFHKNSSFLLSLP